MCFADTIKPNNAQVELFRLTHSCDLNIKRGALGFMHEINRGMYDLDW